MIFPSIPSNSLPNVSSTKLPNVKTPKLPTVPTKINVKTGKGTPGEFVGETGKKASAEVGKLSAAATKIGAQVGQIAGLITNPLNAAILNPVKNKLIAQKEKLMKRANDAKKGAYDYSNASKIPKLSSTTEINVPQVEIPSLPPAPAMPTAPTIPSAPNITSIPKIG